MTPVVRGVWVALVLAAISFVVGTAHPPSSAHRLLQADYMAQHIGSKHYSAHGHLSLPLANAKPFKAVMVVSANTTTPEQLAEYTQQKSSLSGVVIMLPSGWETEPLPAADAANLVRLEQQLLYADLSAVPVFFAKETTELANAVIGTQAMFEHGTPPTKQTDRYELRIQGELPRKLPAKQAMNYVATLRATDDQFKPGVAVAPTLLITAHYDAFSLAPAAAAGADAAASGAAACLLLMRLLQRLYASPETRPSKSIMVLLTSGGPYGQQGLRQWVNDVDPTHLEAIQAAVVLNSIGGSVAVQQQQQQQRSNVSAQQQQQQPQLHMHHMEDPSGSSSSAATAWVDAVEAAAARTGVPLTAVQMGQPPREADAATAGFGHEHLVRKGIPALSLSYMATAPTALPRMSSLADISAAVDLSKVLDAAQVTAEAITRWLHPHLDAQLRLLDLTSQPEQHRDFLAGWIELLSTSANMMPYDKASSSGSALHDNIQQFMRAHSHAAKRHVWSPAGTPAAITAWGGTAATLQVYKAAGFMLDMVLTASTVVYLAGLWAALVVYTRGWSALQAMWKPKPASRRLSRSGSRRS